MSWVDYSILGVFALSVLVGTLRGFVKEVLGLATWVGAVMATYFFSDLIAIKLAPVIPEPGVRIVAAGALLFFGALFVGATITHLIGMLVQEGAVAAIDRTLGAGFGMLRGLVAVVIIVMLADASSATRDKRWWNESVLIPKLMPLAAIVHSWIPERWLAPLRMASVPQPVIVAED